MPALTPPSSPSPSPESPDSLPRSHPFILRTQNLFEFLTNNGLLVDRVRKVLAYMKTQDVNLPILLWAISWNVPELASDPGVSAERTALLISTELPQILACWRKPPRKHNSGIRTKGARDVMEEFAVATVSSIIDREMEALKPIMTSPQEELSEESLLSINWKDMIDQVNRAAPVTWRLFRNAAYTSKQESRNTIKNPDACVLMMTVMASFSRSHNRCKLQKLMTIYFRGCGLAGKALDTLHAFGVTMSTKWSYNGVVTLSEAAHSAMKEDVARFPWFGIHDNINIAFKVYEQRLDNQKHFDSGTAGTIVVIKDPTCVLPDYRAAQRKWAEGMKNPISYLDIINLDFDASPRLQSFAIHQILQLLIDAPDFDFENYKYNDDRSFARPKSTRPLPTGPDHATCQYMLDTVHIEEASYEGNERVLEEWFRQLGLDDLDDRMRDGLGQLIIWVGDQLTVSRIRGLKRFRCMDLNAHDRLDFIKPIFGWFHAQIALEHSLHSQYLGTHAGHGLSHAFELLARKGLQSTSVQGPFHQHIREALIHVATARFRDLWCTVGKVKSLKDLNKLPPQRLRGLAIEIVEKFASVNALDLLSNKPVAQQDNVLAQAVMWNKDILDYLALNDAISTGNIGMIEDLLPRLLFRFAGGTNIKYALEVLELMQGLYKEWPDDLRKYITQYCWLANTTGHPDSFLPIDLLQEHNVRDIKNTFAVLGPFATWDIIRKLSASIPCQRKVKDHVEAEINHFCRGKSHTSPDIEEDIRNLQAAYEKDQIHVLKPGRKLAAKDKVADYMALGADTKLKGVIRRWAENRVDEVATTEDYALYDGSELNDHSI